MAIPGNKATHQAATSSSRPSATISPQAGVGLGIPAPRKLRVDSRIITKPTWSVASTTRLLNTLGKMCFSIIRGFDAPDTLARETKSCTRTDKVSPLDWRAYCAHKKIINTAMIDMKLAPNAATNTKAINMTGIDREISTNLIITASTQPPK